MIIVMMITIILIIITTTTTIIIKTIKNPFLYFCSNSHLIKLNPDLGVSVSAAYNTTYPPDCRL